MRRGFHVLTVLGLVAGLVLAIVACGTGGDPSPRAEKTGIAMDPKVTETSRAIADRYQQHMVEHNPIMVFMGIGDLKLARIPDISEEATRQLADYARSVIAEIDALDPDALTHGDEMLLDILRFQCDGLIVGEQFYWNQFVAEPWFNVVPVIAGFLTKFPLTDAEYVKTYLAVLDDMSTLVAQQREKTAGQAERGIVMPRGVVEYAVAAYRAQIRDPLGHPLVLTAERLVAVDGDHEEPIAESSRAVERLNGELEAMAAFLVGAYKASAPETLAYSQYPNGNEYYQAMLRQNTTLDLTPEQVFAVGQRERDAIERQMAEIRQALGFDGSHQEFTLAAMSDPERVMTTPEEFGERLNACIDRIRPVMSEYFSDAVRAETSAVRIAPGLEQLYHNGVYNPPMPPNQPKGHYFFNGLNMEKKNPLKTPGLAYHEMLPGHHFQIMLTLENEELHPLAKGSAVTAFTEGWAEYASALAGEMGMYDDPASEYGRLENDLYLTNFLILDPGINVEGWTPERMADYLRPYLPDFTEERLTSQIMRVSFSMPGFTTAYKLGSMKMMEFREKAERELGENFDIRDYHRAVLEWGSLPLTILEKHLDWYIEQAKE